MDLLRPLRGGWAAAAEAATPAPPPAIASVDVGTVRQRFNWDWATGENDFDGDTYWWWARSIRVDPNEVIADDDNGGLWSIPFTTDGTDEVTFGTPVRVAETFVPVQAGEGAAATAAVRRRRQTVLAAALDQPTKPDRNTNPRAAVEAAGEEPSMTEEQRRALALSLGLSEDASEADIHTAAAQANATPDADDPPETPALTPEPELVAATTPTDLRDLLGLPTSASEADVVNAARALRDGSEAGARVARAAQAAELDRDVDDAVGDGRIAPSARDAWRSAIDPGERPDAQATARATAERDRLAAMATGRVPVTERGTARTADASQRPASLDRARAAAGLNTNGRNGQPQEVTRRG